MSTHRSSWKRRERDAAGTFAAQRQVLSGSCGRGERSRSDTTHDRLFIEAKLRAKSSLRSQWERVRRLARLESKLPVLALYAKGKPGALIVVHEKDLVAVASELGYDRKTAQGACSARKDEVEQQVGRPIVHGHRAPRRRRQ
jgi:hypothetical protein